jgi:SAM-dependent methyltransferase
MSIVSGILKRFLLPHHLYQVIKLQRTRKKKARVFDDAQLKLYAQLIPGGFLHYGYFENPTIKPEDMSLNDIYQAQENYGHELIKLIKNDGLILDIGCGMGGLIRLLKDNNKTVIGLTPDINQVNHIKEKYPDVQVLDCRFEDMPSETYVDAFQTVITSESLQYLKLDETLPIIEKILKKGGQWIACDYFKIGNQGEKSGHNWDYFEKKLNDFGFAIRYQRDITPNVLPTIAYAYMWATRIGLPLKNFGLEKLAVKAPGIRYVLSETIPEIEKKIHKNIETVNPAIFAANKKYVLMCIERV